MNTGEKIYEAMKSSGVMNIVAGQISPSSTGEDSIISRAVCSLEILGKQDSEEDGLKNPPIPPRGK